MQRALVSAMLLGLSLGCASSPPSRLLTLGTPSGSGPIDFAIQNRTGAAVNNLYLASTRKVRAADRTAFTEGSPEQAALWGEDLLVGAGLEPTGKIRIQVPGPGQYDVRAVDRDGRWQHVEGLRLRSGGRYVLELGEGGWRTPH